MHAAYMQQQRATFGGNVIVPFHSSISVGAATHPATHVALEAAAMGIKTVLVDLDLLGGLATRLLGRRHFESPDASYVDVLRGHSRMIDAVRATGAANCFALFSASARATDLLRDEVRAARIGAIDLFAQLEELSSQFELTIVSLPDRFPPESVHVLERTEFFVTVFEPTRRGLMASELYSDDHGLASGLNLSNLLAAIPFGRHLNRELVRPFAAQYGAALVPIFHAEEFQEIAVFAARPLSAVDPAALSSESATAITQSLLERIALRTGSSIRAGENDPWSDDTGAEIERSRMRFDFSSFVTTEMARIGKAIMSPRSSAPSRSAT